MTVERVAVIGAGTMGNGIAQVFAASGLDVLMTDVSEAALKRGVEAITASLGRLLARQKITQAGQKEGADR